MSLSCEVFFIKLAFIFLISASFVQNHVEDDDSDFYGDTASSLVVEHSFDQGNSPVFTRRGSINIRSITAGTANFRQEAGGLAEDDRQKLKNAANNNGIYRIRVRKSGSESSQYVASFIHACYLVESRLADTIIVNLDSSGNIIGVSLRTGVPYCSNRDVSEKELVHFTTDVDIQQNIVGPSPETQSYIQKMDQEKVEKAKGQQADNRSFFSKYWMYIVPFVVIMMLAQSMDQGGGGGGGGGR